MDRHTEQKEANSELKLAQIEGTVPTVKANMSDVHIAENEAHLFHVEVVKEMHDPVKKKYNKHKNVIKLTQKDVTQMDTHGGQGWTEWDEHTVLHDPTKKKAAKKK